jgi:hypothetical protein
MDYHEQVYIRNPKFRDLEKEKKEREEDNG